MKKLFIILLLSFSICLIGGCSKDVDDNLDPERVDNKEDVEEEKDDEIDEPVEPTVTTAEKEKTIYKNEEYGFTFEIPSWWENSYEVESGTWIDEISKSISFNFESEGVSSNVFTIIILNEKIDEGDWEDPVLTYIVEHNGNTYSYLSSMEPTEELLKEENEKHLQTVSKMVEEVPEIIETFNIGK